MPHGGASPHGVGTRPRPGRPRAVPLVQCHAAAPLRAGGRACHSCGRPSAACRPHVSPPSHPVGVPPPQALTSIEVCVGARTIIMVTIIDVVGHGAVRAIVQRVNRTRFLYKPQLHHKPTHSIGRTFASL